MDLLTLLGRELLFRDGAMGTMLQAAGLKAGEKCESWNLAHPEKVEAVHAQYLAAGCRLITANTFGANALKHGADTDKVVAAGIEIARRAIEKSGADACVALDIGPTGRLLAPMGDLSFEDAYQLFGQMVKAGKDADYILIETQSDLYEVKAAVLAAKENSRLPVVVTLSFDASGRLLTGGDVPAAASLLEGLGVDALGFNCGLGPQEMLKLIAALSGWTRLPIVVSPNAGLPVTVGGKSVYRVTPDGFAEAMVRVADAGAAVVGGCCGTTPEHLSAMTAALRGRGVTRGLPKPRAVISSYARALCLDGEPVKIGKIDLTGREDLIAALREEDYEALSDEAVDQVEAGADVIGINVALPGIDEMEALARTIQAVQGRVRAPLMIETGNCEALARALRVVCGRPLIKPIHGSGAFMDCASALAAKYGAVLGER